MKIKLGKNQPIPKYHSQEAAAFDLCATETTVLSSNVRMMNLEIACEIPKNYVGLLVCRRSMAKLGIRMANYVGVIDSDYRGDIHAPLTSVAVGGTLVEKGDRIVQLMIVPVSKVSLEVVDELLDTERGTSSFGSSGK